MATIDLRQRLSGGSAALAPPRHILPEHRHAHAALASMCVSASDGLTAATIARCLVSIGCARRFLSRPLPIVLFVDDAMPPPVAAFLTKQLNATLQRVANVDWPALAQYPAPPRRLYTFHKLQAWRLAQYQRVLWFDSDAFFTTDPVAHFLERYHPFAAAFFPMHPAGRRSFNSGLMLLQPGAAASARIDTAWRAGNFSAHLGLDDLSEQDLLIAVFGDEFKHMDTCDNFRGRHRPYHKDCVGPAVLHNHFFIGQAAGALAPEMRQDIHRLALLAMARLRQ